MTTGDRPIDFTRGVPADESFPLAELAECAAAVVAGPHGVLVQRYGPSLGFGGCASGWPPSTACQSIACWWATARSS